MRTQKERMDDLCVEYVMVRCKQALGDSSQSTDSLRTAIHTKIFMDWDGPDGSRHEVGKMAIQRGYEVMRDRTTSSARGGHL